MDSSRLHKAQQRRCCAQRSTASVRHQGFRHCARLHAVPSRRSGSAPSLGQGCNNGNNNVPPSTRKHENPGSDPSPGNRGGLFAASMVGVLCTSLAQAPAASAKAQPDPAQKQQDGAVAAYVDQLWTLIGPTVTRMGWSGLLGMAAASALKFIGRSLLVLLGFGFLLVQGLSTAGVVSVHWAEVGKKLGHILDFTGDRVFDADDVKSLLTRGMTSISEGVPDVTGFLVGFTLGLRLM